MNKLSLTLATLGALSVCANAAIVTVTITGHTALTGNITALINFNGNTTTIGNASPFNANAFSANFIGYCVDLSNPAFIGSYLADAKPMSTLSGGTKAGYLYTKYANTGLDTDHSVALQLAIWEVRYDTTLNFTNGNFQILGVGGSVQSFAQTYLNDVIANPSGSSDIVRYDSLGTEQDIMGPVPVPEPASMAVLSLGALAAIRRRRK